MTSASMWHARRGVSTWLLGVVFAFHLPILAAEWTAPYDPARQHRAFPNSPPGVAFPLGTDDLGRDQLSRLLHGARVSLLAAGLATALALTLGLALGLVAGVGGHALDRAVTALGEIVMAVPWIFLLLAIRSALPLDIAPLPAFLLLASLLGMLNWVPAARVVRTSVRHTMRQEYVLAAESIGAGRPRILRTHLLPDALLLLRAQFLTLLPQFVLAEAALSFVGLGLPEPMPTLGTLLVDLKTLRPITEEYWKLAPAVVLAGLVAAYDRMASWMAR